MKTEASREEEEKRGGMTKRRREKVSRKRGCGRRTRRRVQAASTAIQRLFDACRTTFKGPGTVPLLEDVETLKLLLDNMGPEDVGLSLDQLFFKAKSAVRGMPKTTYTTIYKCNNFLLCILFLPPTAVIPLHNHPGMTVFSKLLYGSMHIKSYDWVDPIASTYSNPSSKLRLAKMVVDSDFTAPCDTCILYPTSGGNMHTFKAITPCVVLDVVGPPYSKVEDRDCTYYCDHPFSYCSDGASAQSKGGDCLAWLEEIDIPKDLNMVVEEYRGPQIIDC